MDRQTLINLIRTQQAGLYRYLRYLGAGHEVAEDIVQESFLAMVRHDDAAPAIADPPAYLRGTARNLFLGYCRRRAAQMAMSEDLLARAEAAWSGDRPYRFENFA